MAEKRAGERGGDVAAKRRRARTEEPDQQPIVEEELIVQILASMGVQSFESAVVPQLVEVMHRYTEEILKDAYDYAVHAGRKTTETSDIKVALQIREMNPVLPSREAMTKLALEVNAKPLPPISGVTGLRLPPQELTLLNRPFRVAPAQPEDIVVPVTAPAPAPVAEKPHRKPASGKKIVLPDLKGVNLGEEAP